MNIKNEQKEGNTIVEKVDRIAFFKLVTPGFFLELDYSSFNEGSDGILSFKDRGEK